MKTYQQLLKTTREKQKLSIKGVATKMSFSEQSIQRLEDQDDIFSLNLPTKSLKNYYRKYGECLGLPEKKIVSILNRIDYLDYKRSRKGKMKPFDYLNRLAILTLLALLAYNIYGFYQQQKEQALKQSVITLPAPSTPNTPTPSPAVQSNNDTPLDKGTTQATPNIATHQNKPQAQLSTPSPVESDSAQQSSTSDPVSALLQRN